jgi:hypothetical protein
LCAPQLWPTGAAAEFDVMFEQLGQWVDTYGTTVVPRQARAPAALQPDVRSTR